MNLLRIGSFTVGTVVCLVALACSSERDPATRSSVEPASASANRILAVRADGCPERCPTRPPDPTPAAFACETTLPNQAPTPAVRPGAWPSGGNHGNGALWTGLPATGTLNVAPGQIGHDGSLSSKWGWWRNVEGDLRIEARKLNGTSADWFRADIPEGYGRTGFQVSGLTFATQGCWEVTARAGDHSLTFVVAVIAAP